jgi:signal transduction histidine kinase
LLDLAPTSDETARAGAPGLRRSRLDRALRDARQGGAGPATPGSPSELESELIWRHRAVDERLLSGLRLSAACVVFVAIMTGDGPFHPPAVRLLVGGYVGFAGAVLLASWRGDWVLRRVSVIHGIDMAWTIVASSISGGTGGHIFPFFAFILAASAFRWGLMRAMVDGGIILVVASLQGLAAVYHLVPWAFELDVFILTVCYSSFGAAALFGLFAERQQFASYHATTVARLVAGLNRAPRLSAAMTGLLSTVVRLLGAERVLLVVEEAHTGALSLWQTETQENGHIRASHGALPLETYRHWLLPRSAKTSPCELRRRSEATPVIVSLTLAGDEDAAAGWLSLPRGVAMSSPWKTLLAVPFSAIGVWSGQLYVVDPSRRPRGEIRLRFLADLIQQATPGLVNLYFVRRLRSRAESAERARISRELHDGVLQSLAGLEMRIDVLRRTTAATTAALAGDLEEIGHVIHSESIELRELMQRLRPVDVDARRLPGALADLVDRFSRSGSVEARLEWTVKGLDLPPHHCAEIMRVVQEALFNVRRHSGATRALVRVEADASAWALIVEDNGSGLGFTGRLSHEELETTRMGPRVIRERVTAIGGTVEIESFEAGMRVEITFPRVERE